MVFRLELAVLLMMAAALTSPGLGRLVTRPQLLRRTQMEPICLELRANIERTQLMVFRS